MYILAYIYYTRYPFCFFAAKVQDFTAQMLSALVQLNTATYEFMLLGRPKMLLLGELVLVLDLKKCNYQHFIQRIPQE